MRNLCLALILANLAFAAWQYGRSGSEPARDGEPDVPSIALTSEAAPGSGPAGPAAGPGPGRAAADGPRGAAAGRDDAARAGDADAREVGAGGGGPAAGVGDGAPAAGADTAPRCRSVGPFEELSQAAAAASALRADGYEPSQRVAEGDIWVGYWVYLEDVPSAESETILADLADGGIPEAYLITDAEGGGNVISLGVFAETSRAERRRGESRELGYEPVVEDRTRRGNVYWVDVVLEPGTAELDLAGLQPAARIVRLEQRPCP